MVVAYYQVFILSKSFCSPTGSSPESHSQLIASHVNQDHKVSDQQKTSLLHLVKNKHHVNIRGESRQWLALWLSFLRKICKYVLLSNLVSTEKPWTWIHIYIYTHIKNKGKKTHSTHICSQYETIMFNKCLEKDFLKRNSTLNC